MNARDLDYPTPTTTEFFREKNMAVFAQRVAPLLAKNALGQLRIAEIGCSSGQETWSLAAALAAAGVKYRIDAFDAHKPSIEDARRSYSTDIFASNTEVLGPLPHMSLERLADKTDFDVNCLRYFRSALLSSRRIRPRRTLTKNVKFYHQNLLKTPLEDEKYEAIIINNVLGFYRDPQEYDQLLNNTIRGLRNKGVIMCETVPHWGEDSPLNQKIYLEPVAEAKEFANTILRFNRAVWRLPEQHHLI